MSGKSSVSKTAVWILMGLLILGLGGFGATNFSGTIDSVGKVGETEIDLREYANQLSNEINAQANASGEPVSFVQAQALGLDQRVLSQMVAAAALEEETRLMGVSIGDANLRDQILDIPAFRGLNGEFDREAYRSALQRTGMNEAQFEENIRAEAARTMLQGAVVAGVHVSDSYVDTLLKFIGERRTITWAMLDRNALTSGVPVPDEADLVEYHQTHLPDFTTPETKQITYAWLTPEMIIDEVEVDEQSLRDAYAQREDEFNQPERRLVERLGFTDAATAEAALARIKADETSFDALVEERELSLADVDMGDVSIEDLDAAGEDVFSAEAGDVVGPLDSAIGPALFRVNGILQAQVVTYEDALPQLRDELSGDRARRAIDAEIDRFIDLLAGGATLEDLAAETDMQLGKIRWHPGMTDDIAAYDAFRRAAETITTDAFPDIEQLDDDGVFAMRLDEIIEPEIQPLEDVRAAVEAGWKATAVVSALREEFAPKLDALKSGGSFEENGMTNTITREVTRSEYQPGAPQEFIETVFGLVEEDVTVIDGDGRIFVMRLDQIAPPDLEDEDMTRLRENLRNEAASSKANDFYQILANDIRVRAGVELNQAALNAVHANFQ